MTISVLFLIFALYFFLFQIYQFFCCNAEMTENEKARGYGMVGKSDFSPLIILTDTILDACGMLRALINNLRCFSLP